MLTLPPLPPYTPTALDERIDRELRRAVTERKAAKALGYWPTVQGCDRVIETLRRLQVTAPTQKAVGMVADGRER